MTETEATYTTEPLPECETGSVEQMLNRAVWWGKQIEELARSKEMGLPLAPKWQAMNVSALLASYGVLMSNILEKMQTAEQPTGTESWSEHIDEAYCPACHAKLAISVRMQTTNPHG